MTETSSNNGKETSAPSLHVAPAPHLFGKALTTRRMMLDVLIALTPLMATAIWVFHWYAVVQVGICVLTCVASEAAFTVVRRRSVSVGDLSAVVTGVILGLSLPWKAGWHVGVISSVVAIGIGKVIFGGLGHNIFNPAMVGRAFVTIAFPLALGSAGYVLADSSLNVVTQATPLTAAKQGGAIAPLWALLAGNVNGSLGETSAAACLLGGLYLCLRRSASWEIPAGSIVGLVLVGGIQNLVNSHEGFTVLHHLLGGAFLYGAFFIATDPVSSPLTHKGKWIYGFIFGVVVMLIRLFSGYPEGVQFTVLFVNGLAPLINRWTVPTPVGGPVPSPAGK